MSKKLMIWGLIIFGIGLPFALIDVFVEEYQNIGSTISLFVHIIVFSFLLRKEMIASEGITYGGFFKISAITAAFTGLLVGAYSFLLVNFLRPDFLEAILYQTEKNYYELGQSEEITKDALEISQQMFSSPIFHVFTNTFQYLIFFGIISLLSTWLIKKRFSK